MSGKGEKEQVYARYVASGKTVEHLASWGKTLVEVMNPEGKARSPGRRPGFGRELGELQRDHRREFPG